MIKSLIKEGYFNYDKFLLENYYNIGLKFEEIPVLKVFIEQFIKNDLNLKKAEKIIKSLISNKVYKEISPNLLENNFFSISIDYTCGKEVFSIDGLFLKIEDYYRNNITELTQQNSILEVLKKECIDQISPLQYQQILEYINNKTLTLEKLNKIIYDIKEEGSRVEIYKVLSLITTPIKSTDHPLINKLIKDNGWKVK